MTGMSLAHDPNIPWAHPDNKDAPREIGEGHEFEYVTFLLLKKTGLPISQPPKMATRPHYDDREEYRDGADIMVAHWKVSVKSRKDSFEKPSDLYGAPIVDTEKKLHEFAPDVVICWSRPTAAVMWCSPMLVQSAWKREWLYDPLRGYWDWFITLPPEYWARAYRG